MRSLYKLLAVAAITLFALLGLVRADDASIDEKDVVILADGNFTAEVGKTKFALVRGRAQKAAESRG
jgi:uncharacterized membrane protein YeiH